MWHWELIPFVLSAVVTAGCAVFIWRRRTGPGAKAFTVLLLSETAWSAGYVAELSSPDLSGKLFWDDVQYVAMIVLLPSMLVFVWDYLEKGPEKRGRWLALYMAVPLATLGWVLSDGLHHAARASARVEAAPPFGTLLYDFTLLELLLVVQSYGTILYLTFALLQAARGHHRDLRLQTFLIVLGLVFPMISGTLGMLGLRFLLGQRDSAPACFGVAALAITWALFRGRFFDIAPVARHVVFDSLPDPVFVLDRDERVVDLNPCAQALLGAEQRAVGQPLSSLFTADAVSCLSALRHVGRIELEIAGRTFEARSEPLDAASRHGRVVLLQDISARKSAEHALTRAHEALELRVTERTRALHATNQAMQQEIGERKRVEEAARQSEERFRALFDNAVELMGTLGPDGRLLAANRTALDFAGISADDVQGVYFWDAAWWSHSEELQGKLREAVARAAVGELVKMEVTHPAPNGELRSIDFSLKRLVSSAAQEPLLIAEGRDITDLKRAEEERATLREALHQAQKLDSIGRLAGGIAHDFNNLLTVILGQIELGEALLEHGADPRPCLEQATQAGMSAAGLTRQLLAFARKQPTAPRVLSMNDVVEQTHRMLQRLIGEDVELHLSLSAPLQRVRIDPGQLEQVLVNLAVNARDAMPAGGELYIATDNVELTPAQLRAQGMPDGVLRYVRLRVIDTGPGVAPAVLAKVFEPFFTTKAPGKGTGIGLSTVYGIAQQAGGFVAVQSEAGKGATFEVYLPATEQEASLPPVSSQLIPRGSERVALVEDQAALRDLVSHQLNTLGYQVTAYARAEDALEALHADGPAVDLLVTDVVLAGMSGPTLVSQLQRAHADLKVLYVSGYTNGAIFARGLDENAVRLLHKPFTIRELAQAVRGVLEGAT